MKNILQAGFLVFFLQVLAYGESLDYIIKQASNQQGKIENNIRDMSYTAKSSFIQKDNTGKIEKRIQSKRIIYNKKPDEISQNYISMNINGRELSKGELDKEAAKQNRGGKKVQAKSPFSPEMKGSYAFNLEGETNFNGRDAWIIGFSSKEKKDNTIDGKAYISKKDFNVLYLDITPAKVSGAVKMMEMHMTFSNVTGYWLPSKFEMKMNLKVSFILTIADKYMEVEESYSGYKINTGMKPQIDTDSYHGNTE